MARRRVLEPLTVRVDATTRSALYRTFDLAKLEQPGLTMDGFLHPILMRQMRRKKAQLRAKGADPDTMLNQAHPRRYQFKRAEPKQVSETVAGPKVYDSN